MDYLLCLPLLFLIVWVGFRFFIIWFYPLSFRRWLTEILLIFTPVFYLIFWGNFQVVALPFLVGKLSSDKFFLSGIFKALIVYKFDVMIIVALSIFLHTQNLRSVEVIFRGSFRGIREIRQYSSLLLFILLNVFSLPALLIERYFSKPRLKYFDSVVQGSEYIRDNKTGIFLLRIMTFVADIRYFLDHRSWPKDPLYYIHPDVPIKRSHLNVARLNYGSPGSGKTNQIWNHEIQQIIRLRERMIIYDYKGDFTEALGDRNDTQIISPFDSRSPAWNVAKDVDTSMLFLELMWSIVGSSFGIQKKQFFDTAFVDVATGVFRSLRDRFDRGEWSFGDLYERMHQIQEVKSDISEYRPEASMFIKGKSDGDQTAGVWGTIREKMVNLLTWPKVVLRHGFDKLLSESSSFLQTMKFRPCFIA